jgi:hypothetical protein
MDHSYKNKNKNKINELLTKGCSFTVERLRTSGSFSTLLPPPTASDPATEEVTEAPSLGEEDGLTKRAWNETCVVCCVLRVSFSIFILCFIFQVSFFI